MAMSKTQIFARRVKIARAALALTVKDFAKFVGVSPNTISQVENAHNTLGVTTDGIEEALSHIQGLDWFPDNGKTIGIRLHYNIVPRKFDDAPKLRSHKKGRGRRSDKVAFDLNRRESDYPIEKSMQEYHDHEKRYGPDKRVRRKSSGPVKV